MYVCVCVTVTTIILEKAICTDWVIYLLGKCGACTRTNFSSLLKILVT